MSVEGTGEVRHRPFFNPEGDPSLPQAIWYGQAAVIGDVSGGHRKVVLVLNAENRVRSGLGWSVERVLLTNAENAGRNWRVNSLNMDVLGPGLTNPIQKAFGGSTVSTAAGNQPVAASLMRDNAPRLYLGTQGASAVPAELEAVIVNSDGDTFSFYATGYVWGPMAINIGARRPLYDFLG